MCAWLWLKANKPRFEDPPVTPGPGEYKVEHHKTIAAEPKKGVAFSEIKEKGHEQELPKEKKASITDFMQHKGMADKIEEDIALTARRRAMTPRVLFKTEAARLALASSRPSTARFSVDEHGNVADSATGRRHLSMRSAALMSASAGQHHDQQTGGDLHEAPESHRWHLSSWKGAERTALFDKMRMRAGKKSSEQKEEEKTAAEVLAEKLAARLLAHHRKMEQDAHDDDDDLKDDDEEHPGAVDFGGRTTAHTLWGRWAGALKREATKGKGLRDRRGKPSFKMAAQLILRRMRFTVPMVVTVGAHRVKLDFTPHRLPKKKKTKPLPPHRSTVDRRPFQHPTKFKGGKGTRPLGSARSAVSLDLGRSSTRSRSRPTRRGVTKSRSDETLKKRRKKKSTGRIKSSQSASGLDAPSLSNLGPLDSDSVTESVDSFTAALENLGVQKKRKKQKKDRRISAQLAADRCNRRCCSMCGISEENSGMGLWRCKNCQQVMYCGRDCQVKHWTLGHADACLALQQGKTPLEIDLENGVPSKLWVEPTSTAASSDYGSDYGDDDMQGDAMWAQQMSALGRGNSDFFGKIAPGDRVHITYPGLGEVMEASVRETVSAILDRVQQLMGIAVARMQLMYAGVPLSKVDLTLIECHVQPGSTLMIAESAHVMSGLVMTSSDTDHHKGQRTARIRYGEIQDVMRVPLRTTVAETKLKLQKRLDVPVADQALFYGDVLLLNDAATLEEYVGTTAGRGKGKGQGKSKQSMPLLKPQLSVVQEEDVDSDELDTPVDSARGSVRRKKKEQQEEKHRDETAGGADADEDEDIVIEMRDADRGRMAAIGARWGGDDSRGVRIYYNQNIILQAQPDETVGEVRRLLSDITCVPVEEVQLVHWGTVLKDPELCLSDYEVQGGDALRMVRSSGPSSDVPADRVAIAYAGLGTIMTVPLDTTLSYIKHELCEEIGIPMDEQQLRFAGLVLRGDNKTLQQLNVIGGGTVMVHALHGLAQKGVVKLWYEEADKMVWAVSKDTVSTVRKQLAAAGNHNKNDIDIIYRGKMLSTKRTLKECDIQSGATLKVIRLLDELPAVHLSQVQDADGSAYGSPASSLASSGNNSPQKGQQNNKDGGGGGGGAVNVPGLSATFHSLDQIDRFGSMSNENLAAEARVDAASDVASEETITTTTTKGSQKGPTRWQTFKGALKSFATGGSASAGGAAAHHQHVPGRIRLELVDIFDVQPLEENNRVDLRHARKWKQPMEFTAMQLPPRVQGQLQAVVVLSIDSIAWNSAILKLVGSNTLPLPYVWCHWWGELKKHTLFRPQPVRLGSKSRSVEVVKNVDIHRQYSHADVHLGHSVVALSSLAHWPHQVDAVIPVYFVPSEHRGKDKVKDKEHGAVEIGRMHVSLKLRYSNAPNLGFVSQPINTFHKVTHAIRCNKYHWNKYCRHALFFRMNVYVAHDDPSFSGMSEEELTELVLANAPTSADLALLNKSGDSRASLGDESYARRAASVQGSVALSFAGSHDSSEWIGGGGGGGGRRYTTASGNTSTASMPVPGRDSKASLLSTASAPVPVPSSTQQLKAGSSNGTVGPMNRSRTAPEEKEEKKDSSSSSSSSSKSKSTSKNKSAKAKKEEQIKASDLEAQLEEEERKAAQGKDGSKKGHVPKVQGVNCVVQ